ncbi:hypothetical protein GP486_002095 [Trichoglossum hirsutum]|uniref:Peptidase S8/S53 domain-containing protein n=1 Tax=Trichoglossum hirsutum TaxID=265104 RepID=A0A9P8RSE5_9PEZI|nr:hypothetical protein GP486_002095 [Trichoglossum hirsutum]
MNSTQTSQPIDSEQLQSSVSRGDYEEVQRLIELFPPPYRKDWLDLLEIAWKHERRDIRDFILDKLEKSESLGAPGMVRDVFELDICRSQSPQREPTIALALLERNHSLRPEDYGKRLGDAARYNSLPVLEKLLPIINKYPHAVKYKLLRQKHENGLTPLELVLRAKNKHTVASVELIIRLDPKLLEVQAGYYHRTPLHGAVESGDAQLVKLMVDSWPRALLVHDDDGNPPYHYIEEFRQRTGDNIAADIMTELLQEKIFREFKSVAEIREARYGTHDTRKELSLDLSDFDLPTHYFTKFAQDISKYGRDQTGLRFEKMLTYVQLPNFDRSNGNQFHDDTQKLFRWLHDKGVRLIRDLSIPDSRSTPIPDEQIEEMLQPFTILNLNWRRLDLSIDTIHASVRDVHELHLYSSGNWAVLCYWSMPGVLGQLEQLVKLTVTIVSTGERSRARLEKYKKDFEDRLKLLRLGFEIVVTIGLWTSDSIGILRESHAKPHEYTISDELRLSHSFLEELESLKGPEPGRDYIKENPIKIAVIDSGVDQCRTTISDNIERGESFVEIRSESGMVRESPWWLVADPHGTQMASLITQVNPYCKLYVGKVARYRGDLVVENVVKAINWAIEQGVDIISISLVFHKASEDLATAIREAASKHILIICSRADLGAIAKDTFPADYKDQVISISATTRNLKPRADAEARASFLMVGEDILADGPKYIGAGLSDRISGSSVATALVAGIASLILTHDRYANPEDNTRRVYHRRSEMAKFFERHMVPGGKNVLQPSHIFAPYDGWGKDEMLKLFNS